jgi:hypothetical protein
VQNARNIGLVDTVFEELVSEKSFTETCNLLRSHAIKDDQQNKEKAARQIHNASQCTSGTKRDKVKKVLALINKMHIQESSESDEEQDIMTPSKTAMVCKLAQIPPEIWKSLSIDAMKWLLNERKRQQIKDDVLKSSLHLDNKEPGKASDRDGNNPNIPNQYARVKNTSKGEKEILNETVHDQNYIFIDEFMEEAVKNSNLYECNQEEEYDLWYSEHNMHASIRISSNLFNKGMNLLFLPERYHTSILDGGADTCVLGKGWEVISTHKSRMANVVGFDHETAIKWNLPIVSSITSIDLPNGQSIILVIHEGKCNETSNHKLLSEFQLREFGIVIDSICNKHGGSQQMLIKDNNNDLITIPLELAGFWIKLHTSSTNRILKLRITMS